MMARITRRRLIALLAIVATVAASAWGMAALRDAQDKKEVKRMTHKMMTVCLGRFLLDVPEGADIYFNPATIDGVAIEVDPLDSENAFNERIKHREQELKTAKNEAGHASLEKKEDIKHNDLSGVLFKYDRNSSYWFAKGQKVTAEGMKVEAWVHDKKIQFKRFPGLSINSNPLPQEKSRPTPVFASTTASSSIH